MDKPKISIITPTYNSANTIEGTIKSVIGQGYSNLEYIVIDGGSTDDTVQIIQKYLGNIAYFVSEPDRGISDAFNKGIEKATGDIIGIINSDDLLMPNALETVANAFNPNIGVYRGNTVLWDAESGNTYRSIPTMRFRLTQAFSGICHPSTFILKSCYDSFGLYDVNFRFMMDVDILYRLYFAGASFKYIDEDLAKFRLGGVTTTSYKKKTKELRAVIVKNGGSDLVASYRCCAFVVKNWLKNLLIKVLGEDGARRARYRRSDSHGN